MSDRSRNSHFVASCVLMFAALASSAYGEPREEFLRRTGLLHYTDTGRTSPVRSITCDIKRPTLSPLKLRDECDLHTDRTRFDTVRFPITPRYRFIEREKCDEDDAPTVIRPMPERHTFSSRHDDPDRTRVTSPPLYHNADLRMRIARRLTWKGVEADWQKQTLSDLTDIECRMRITDRLAKAGHKVDWKLKTHAELLDMEDRIRLADRLATLGKLVDWRSHSLTELIIMESKLQTAAASQQRADVKD